MSKPVLRLFHLLLIASLLGCFPFSPLQAAPAGSNEVAFILFPSVIEARSSAGKPGMNLLLETQDLHSYGTDLILPAKTNLLAVFNHDFAVDLESLWKETAQGFQLSLFKGGTNSPEPLPGFTLCAEMADAKSAEQWVTKKTSAWKTEGRAVLQSNVEGKPYFAIEKNRLIANGQTNLIRPYFLTGPLFFCASCSNQFLLSTSENALRASILANTNLASIAPKDAQGKTAYLSFLPGETEKLFFGPTEKLTNGNSIVDSDMVLGSFMTDVARTTLAYTSGAGADDLRFFFQTATPARPFMRILRFDTNSAVPPDFVKEDAVSFHRYRINMPDFFQNFEKQLGGFARLIVETVGKDKDPNFDTRTNIFQLTGNDIVYYEVPTVISNTPSSSGMLFIASSNPELLGSNVQTFVTSLLPGNLSSFSRTNIAGVAYSTFSLPPMPMWGLNTTTQTVACTVYSNYLVFASETSVLEKFLSPARTNLLPLAQSEGWKKAQAVLGQTDSALGFARKPILSTTTNQPPLLNEKKEVLLFFSAATGTNGLDLHYVVPR
ncbi:MAG: hypothetical protein JWN25_970 [Verrucomicrobiales bacterium]|nr:hypothetical protein [Verrucomicrobiales bacterium]